MTQELTRAIAEAYRTTEDEMFMQSKSFTFLITFLYSFRGINRPS